MIFEVCVDSVEGALAAQAGGAQRIELCDNLVEGGTTPSLGMIQVVRRMISIDMIVIIRPRGGDFFYSNLEYEIMVDDIRAAKQAGANGVALGLLHLDGTVDAARTRALIELARPMSVTFHRAFDMTRDPDDALSALCRLGIDRVLTSGQKATALEGSSCIARLVSRAGSRTIIMAGGGIDALNAAVIIERTGVKEIHFSARAAVKSLMLYRNPACRMGKAYQPDEYARKETDAALVSRVIQSVE